MVGYKIDGIDRDLIRDYNWWLSEGRLSTRIDGKKRYLHRVIAERMGFDSDKRIYHKNSNRLDFRRSNLTDISPVQKSIRENALIDAWNMNLIEEHSWGLCSGYLQAKVDGKIRLLHHLIAERMGLDSSKQIDHIDRNKENNHESNLREATHSQNMMNKGIRSDNTSGYPGVYYDMRYKTWRVYINIKSKRIHLGCFKHKKDAIKSRQEAEIKYFGEFANHAHN